jgi:DNA-binding NarL/FixJ family response regulator
MERLRVAVRAADPISEAGVLSCLATHPDVQALPSSAVRQPDVAVATADRLTASGLARLRRETAMAPAPTVLVTSGLAGTDLLAIVECRVVVVLPRAAVTASALVRSVLTAASGGGLMPSELVGALVDRVRLLQQEVLAPHGLNAAGIVPREVDVLRLIADGFDTRAIADKLGYAERTVTNIVHDVINKLGVRNRSHAVACALRAGVI